MVVCSFAFPKKIHYHKNSTATYVVFIPKIRLALARSLALSLLDPTCTQPHHIIASHQKKKKKKKKKKRVICASPSISIVYRVRGIGSALLGPTLVGKV